MQHHNAFARQQQRRAAIVWVAAHRPGEAANKLLPHVTNSDDAAFLRRIDARKGLMSPEDRERLIRIATPLMSVVPAA